MVLMRFKGGGKWRKKANIGGEVGKKKSGREVSVLEKSTLIISDGFNKTNTL
jgi:hypothetical protein